MRGLCVLAIGMFAFAAPCMAQSNMPPLPLFQPPGGVPTSDPASAWLNDVSVFSQAPYPRVEMASPVDTLSAVGSATAEVACPDDRQVEQNQMSRGARVYIGSDGLPSQPVLNRLIAAGQTLALRQCPMGPNQGLGWINMGFVQVFSTANGGNDLLLSVRNYQPYQGWAEVATPADDQAKAAQAKAQADAQAAQAQAQANAQAAQAQAQADQVQVQADQAAEQARQQAEQDADARHFRGEALAFVERWTPWALAIGFLIWLFSIRRAFARWYYFHFHPHPAEPMVRSAIASASISDATSNAIATALSQMPPGSSTLRAVRLAQAERLFRDLQSASAARQEAIERRARAGAAAAREEALYYGVQEAVLLAAAALERAKAAYQAALSR